MNKADEKLDELIYHLKRCDSSHGKFHKESIRILEALKILINTLPKDLKGKCYSNYHDDRWCQTCEDSLDTIDLIQTKIKKLILNEGER